MIFCSYKTDYTSLCGCRKTGLECTLACINCYNTNCTNSPLSIHEEELENENVESDRETHNDDIVQHE